MSGLLSIAPLVETVEVSGQKVSVPGVGLRGVASLFQRFPALRSVFQGGANLDDLVSVAPDAVAAVIAAGTGNPGSEKHEKAADGLPLDAQLDLLAAIKRVTMPKGPGPFVAKVSALIQGEPAPVATAQATNSRKRTSA
jgi:hypothetical protein